MAIKRAKSRVAFGQRISEMGVTKAHVADMRMEIDMARLLVLKAAWAMDKFGNKEARQQIAMIKVAVPNISSKVVDRCLQLHGAGGVSQVFKLASMYAHQRTLRLADGPDEVHRDQVGRLEIAKYNYGGIDRTRGTGKNAGAAERRPSSFGHDARGFPQFAQFPLVIRQSAPEIPSRRLAGPASPTISAIPAIPASNSAIGAGYPPGAARGRRRPFPQFPQFPLVIRPIEAGFASGAARDGRRRQGRPERCEVGGMAAGRRVAMLLKYCRLT